MLKKVALWFGVVLLVVGVLGFVPGITTDEGKLLGVFQVDTVHNIVHLLTGIVAVAVSYSSMKAQRLYFQVFGVVYLLVTIVGFVQGDTVLGIFDTNMADHVLHLLIAAFALYAGFGMKGETTTAAKPAAQM